MREKWGINKIVALYEKISKNQIIFNSKWPPDKPMA